MMGSDEFALVFCQLRSAAERAGPAKSLDQFSLPTDPPFRPATRLRLPASMTTTGSGAAWLASVGMGRRRWH
jgi:hypothetical protein